MLTEQANRITIEEQLALAPASVDTEEEAVFRAQVKLNLAKIKEAGNETQIPNE